MVAERERKGPPLPHSDRGARQPPEAPGIHQNASQVMAPGGERDRPSHGTSGSEHLRAEPEVPPAVHSFARRGLARAAGVAPLRWKCSQLPEEVLARIATGRRMRPLTVFLGIALVALLAGTVSPAMGGPTASRAAAGALATAKRALGIAKRPTRRSKLALKRAGTPGPPGPRGRRARAAARASTAATARGARRGRRSRGPGAGGPIGPGRGPPGRPARRTDGVRAASRTRAARGRLIGRDRDRPFVHPLAVALRRPRDGDRHGAAAQPERRPA